MTMNYSHDEIMEQLLSDAPPAPIVWCSKAIDLLCLPLGCGGLWRDYTPSLLRDWFHRSHVGDLSKAFPDLITFSQFYSPADHGTLYEGLYKYAFETKSTALGDLTTPTALLVLFALVLCLRMLKTLLLPAFSSLGRWAGRQTHGLEWEKANHTRIVKFGEYVFRLLYHSAISILGYYLFRSQDYWKPGGTKALFADYPLHPIEPGMAWYYLIQSAYNIEALWSLLELSFVVSRCKSKHGFPYLRLDWSPDIRGDFREMAIHHVVTNLLVVGSSYFRFCRIGSMVFWIHDVSDVPVDLSKLANFVKFKKTTALCFATMVLAWWITRLYLLPFVVYRSLVTESHYVLQNGLIAPIYYQMYRHFFYVLLGSLILLHTLWFLMFLKMGYLLVFKGETHDLSEHKKGETQSLIPNEHERATLHSKQD